MIFKRLGEQKLHELIGKENLKRIISLLPVLDNSIDELSLYKTNTLSKIFGSFSDTTIFKKKLFREELFSSLFEEEIDEILNDLGILNTTETFESKVQRLVKVGWSNRSKCLIVLNRLELPEYFAPSRHILYQGQQTLEPPITPFKSLKDYQQGVYNKAKNEFQVRNSRFIVQMPTGSGKTRTSMELVSHVLQTKVEGTVVIWLVNKEELCEQAVQSFIEVWSHIGNKNVDVFRVWGKNDFPSTIQNSSFVVCGFPKLWAILNKNKSAFDNIKESISLIVIDEAHMVLARTYLEVTNALRGTESSIVGLTATPGRKTDLESKENADLSSFFFKGNITIDSNGKPVIDYLRNRKILSSANFKILETSPSIELTQEQIDKISNSEEIPKAILKLLGEDSIRNLEILKEILKEINIKQILLFACSIQQSKFICSVLTFLGHEAYHIDGNTEKSLRRSILNRFKNGDIKFISNYEILSTGFDAPKTDLVFIARPTKSVVLYSQMIGRGLRGPEIGGTLECDIITVVDNLIGLPNPTEMFHYFDEYFINI